MGFNEPAPSAGEAQAGRAGVQASAGMAGFKPAGGSGGGVAVGGLKQAERDNENETSRLKFYEVKSASPAGGGAPGKWMTGMPLTAAGHRDESSSGGVLRMVSSVGGAAS